MINPGSANVLGLTELDVLAGTPLGEQPGLGDLPENPPGLTPRAALEEAVLAGLARPPCIVAFSGGRDSSAVLALATHLARREGLPLPVPMTYVFPSVPAANESSWQQLLVTNLGLRDWNRREITDEFDVLGPEAKAVLRRYGVLVPYNLYVQAPLMREARGGTVLTGFDGDGLFASWRWARAASVLALREMPRPRDLFGVALAAAPSAVRVGWMRRRAPRQRWLRPDAEQMVSAAWARERAGEPRTWRRWIAWYARCRAVVVTQRTVAMLAEEAGTTVRHPLLDPRFLAAVARADGRSGPGTRTDWMQRLFSDVLPPATITRSDKADLQGAFLGKHSLGFIDDWDGSGVDEGLVDVEALREAWRAGNWRSMPLLHAAWLSSSPDAQSQPLELTRPQ
jgi:asparagine synthase (glutamine-hydrolysing)